MELVGLLWQRTRKGLIEPITRLRWGEFFVSVLFVWPMVVGNICLLGVLFPEKPGNYYAAAAVAITAVSAVAWAGLAIKTLLDRH